MRYNIFKTTTVQNMLFRFKYKIFLLFRFTREIYLTINKAYPAIKQIQEFRLRKQNLTTIRYVILN